MDEQTTPEEKRHTQNNNILLVCGMLTFYGFCMLASFGAIVGALQYEKQAYTVNVTSTAFAVETQHENAAATAIVRAAEQEQYEFIERFDEVSGRWFVGTYARSNGDIRVAVKDSVYIWDIRDPKTYSQSADFYKGNKIRDFDVYVDLKFVETSQPGAACSGLFFRRPTTNWGNGAYTFTICDDSYYKVQYYGDGAWQTITYSEYPESISPNDWIRVGVGARNDRFTFSINNIEVFKMVDTRLEQGSLGIFIEVYEKNFAELWFDNFGFQSR